MSILKFGPTYLKKRKLFGTLQPCCSRNWAFLLCCRRWKCYQSISRPKKHVEPNFHVILTYNSGFTIILKFFQKNLAAVIPVSVFCSYCFTGNLCPPTVFDISGCGFSHSTHNKIVYKLLEQIFELLSQKFFTALQS